MSVSKGWVDLDGTSIALQSSLDILHLLQRIAHVGIGISKCGADPKIKAKVSVHLININYDNMHLQLHRQKID